MIQKFIENIRRSIKVRQLRSNADLYCTNGRCPSASCPLRKAISTGRGYGVDAIACDLSCTAYCPTTKSWKTLVNEINRK